MQSIDLQKDIAAMGGYTITGSSGQDPINKTRALRRLNTVKADIISRFGGRWPSQYREGWLPLAALVNTGTVAVTLNSNIVTGTLTTWNSTTLVAEGYKFKGPDGAYYKVASVQSDTQLTLTQPYQSVTNLTGNYQIWKDEYVVYPEVLSIGGFVDYGLEGTMEESWPRNMKNSYPVPTSVELPTVYTVIGRKLFKGPYSTGTVSGTSGTNTLTGVGTAWLANVEPGYEITVAGITYHVKKVFSDTSLEVYQLLTTSPSAATYTTQGKNSLIVRFREPTSQRIVHYWYWAKSYPLINDADEDWVCEMYPEVIQLGANVKDYLDKNDVARANMSKMTYENAVKDMKVSEDNAYVGVRTLGYSIPPEARD